MTRTLTIAASLMLLVAASPDNALAQFYKGKTVAIIINYPAGGPSDIEGRVVAQHSQTTFPASPMSSSRT